MQARIEVALQQLARQLGGLSETVGGDLEDIAYIVLYDVLKREFGWEVGVLERTGQHPERDAPEILARYAQAHGVNLNGWAFLTGTPDVIRTVTRQCGIHYKTQVAGIDRTFLTSLVNQHGTLRVEYLGVRFASDELLRDHQSLLPERAAQ